MGDSDGKSRRGVIGILAILVIGLIRFGEELVRILDRPVTFLRVLSKVPQATDSVQSPTQTQDSSENFSFEENGYGTRYNVQTNVETGPGRYTYWDHLDFANSEQNKPYIEYDVVVEEGPPVDVFVITQEEFSSFERGESFLYLEESSTGTKHGLGSGILDYNSYYFIVDNSARGPTQPEDSDWTTATVSVSITITESYV